MTRLDERLDETDDPAGVPIGEATAAQTDGSEGETTSIYLPPFRIDVTVRPDAAHLTSRNRVAAAVRAALESAGAPGPASIGVVLSNDTELAELNVTHMGATGATDVLSFPFFPPEAFPNHERGIDPQRDPWVAAALKQAFALPPGLRAHLGDIIVSVERAIAQAADGRGGQTGDVHWTAVEELLLLAVHGTLHVCGWDHAEPVEEAAMRAKERQVLASLPHHDGHDGQEEADPPVSVETK
ncbi:MAG TPA: rRNA maturation RNase YbeY [Candidatus Limnocylindrales bacterium]